MYVFVTLRNPIISRATRKRSITCASVTLRNVTAVPAIEVRGEIPPRTSTIVRDVGDAVRTQSSGGQPDYIRGYSCSVQPISSALYQYIPAAETL